MARQIIVSREVQLNFARRIESENVGQANMTSALLHVTLELIGPVNDMTGHLIEPDTLTNIISENLIGPFQNMMVLRIGDPLLETLVNKPLINNSGWESLYETMRESINREGYYDTRRQALPPFYNSLRPTVIAERPTSENLAYLMHQLVGPSVYTFGVTQMRAKLTEGGHGAIFVADVRPSPDYPVVA